ncbi:MAG: class I SAM-dependent methyltransferase [Oscillospiraceae bacterium]|nr:class I SAM-dependent methyltransferase [Oscillospiraceae bacterium]
MKLEFLGEAFWQGGKRIGAFLFGCKGLADLQNEQIFIWGTGELANRCVSYLIKNGLRVSRFCDNDKRHQNNTFLGLPITPPPPQSNLNAYFIICAQEWNLWLISRQLSVRYGDDFSFFFLREFGDFFDNRTLMDATLRSLNAMLQNEIIYGHKKVWHQFIEEATPGRVMQLCQSTTHWDATIKWLSEPNYTRPETMLDIGPGWGTLSYIINDLYGGVDTTWVCVSKKERWDDAYIDWENMQYPVKRIFGLIENPSFSISERYDLIILTEVMEHFSCNPVSILNKIREWLNHNGKFILSTPSPTAEPLRTFDSYKQLPKLSSFEYLPDEEYAAKNINLQKYLDPSNAHIHIYDRWELEEIFHECGLKVVKYELNARLHHCYMLEADKK